MTAITSSTAALTSAQSLSLIQSITGLNVDTNSLISSLVTAEGQAAFTQINNQTSAVNTQLSGLGALNSALSSFRSSLSGLQTGSVFQTNTATSSNKSILTVTPGSGAVTASHAVQVQSLATAQSSITTAEFANSAATVGTGSLTFTSGSGSTFTASIPSGSNSSTLADWVNAINNASDNTSVSASIINVDSSTNLGTTISRLVLTANNPGTAHAFTVTAKDDGGIILTGNSGLAQLASANLSNQGTGQVSTSNAEFADSAGAVDSGILSFTSSSGSFNVTVDNGNNTLAGLVNAINNATGNSSVLARIVTDPVTNLSQLQLSSNAAFTVTGSSSSQFSSSNLTTTTPSTTDAVIFVDGQKATRSSNTINDVLPGLTLNLQSAAIGTSVNVGVSLDTGAINSAVSNFVNAFNSLQQTTQSLGTYGGIGGTNGALIGDPTLEFAHNQIRQMSTAPVSTASGDYNSLAMIGVTVDQYGVMSLDSTRLKAALSANIQSVSNVFSSSAGVAVKLSNLLSNLIGTGGTIGKEQTSLNAQLTSLQKQTTNKNKQLDAYKATLQAQFTAMQSIVGQYHNSSSFLSNWIKSNSSNSSGG